MGQSNVLISASVAVACAGCVADAVEHSPPRQESSQLSLAARRGRSIWFENTFGGEKFFAFLRKHPDAKKRLDVGFANAVLTPRNRRFDVWGVLNDPDCVANPSGGLDICPNPTASGVVGLRKFEVAPGQYIYGASCASCHAGLDPLDPPADPNDLSWHNIHPSIGNQYLKTGKIFAANLEPTDPRNRLFSAWPDGTVDTTLLFNDGIYNPGVFTAFWEHKHRPVFANGTNGDHMRNGQGGEDDVGRPLAALRVYTNIGACFFECVAAPASRGVPISIDQCKASCRDWPSDAQLDDLGAFLSTIKAPRYSDDDDEEEEEDDWDDEEGEGGHDGDDDELMSRGRRVFRDNCSSCHTMNRVLSNDEVNSLAEMGAHAPNRCRALTTNWDQGKLWAYFSSARYKARGTAGGKGYRTMPLTGIWATAPFFHNQSIGVWAPPTATPAQRAAAYETSMWELLSYRAPKINELIPGFSTVPTADGPVTLCDDVVENAGHYYGADLPRSDKAALIEWLKYQ